MSDSEFDKYLRKVYKQLTFKPTAALKKSVYAALSERDEKAEAIIREPDTDLRDHEQVPLGEDWRTYFEREVLPFVPDAWVDESYTDDRDGGVGRVGYEINFNRYFYKYTPPRPLEEIDAELKLLESEIADLLREVAS